VTLSGVFYKWLKNKAIELREFPISEVAKGLSTDGYLVAADINNLNENGDLDFFRQSIQ